MSVDIKNLTLGEIDFFENTTGRAIATLGDSGAFMGKPLAVLVYLFKHREDSNFSLNDAMNWSTTQATDYLGFGDEVDEESDEGKAERSLTSEQK